MSAHASDERAVRGPGRSASLASVASLVLGVSTIALVGWPLVAHLRNASAPATLPPPLSVLVIGAVVAVVAAVPLLRTQRPGAPVGLALAAFGALLPLWSSQAWLTPTVRAGLLAASPLAVLGLAHVARGPDLGARRASVSADRLVAISVIAAVAVHWLGYDPFTDPGCVLTCRHAPPAVGGSATTTRAVVAVASALTILAAGTAAAVAVPPRRSRGRSSVTATAAVTGLTVLAGLSAVRWVGYGDRTVARSVLSTAPLVVGAVGVVGCLVAHRTQRTRAQVGHLVTALAVDTGGLHLPGPIIGVSFAVPGEARWVDPSGSPADDPPGHTITLGDGAEPAIRLAIAGRSDDTIAALTPQVRLALRNAQLSAVIAAGLREVRASQRRVVTTADAERRRIERDLHDGAQQRLVTAAFHLEVATSGADPQTDEHLRRSRRLVAEALGHLRELASGLHPRVLTDEGLVVALRELAADSDVPITLAAEVDGEIPGDVEMAVFALVRSVIAEVSDGPVSAACHVQVSRDQRALQVDVHLHGRSSVARSLPTPEVLTDLEDRIGAIGGRLHVTRDASAGVLLSAVIPCES